MSARVESLLANVLPGEAIGRFAGGHGHREAPEAAPRTSEEALGVLRLARAERWSLLALGNATKLAWLRPRGRVDLVLSSRNLRGITAYEPADGTITALAGTPWAELTAATAGRHHLSPELPESRATLGGAVAAGESGFDRLRHGPLRHQILGLTALHADGTRVKSGGRVVKNVTGYDLHRLWCGSEGTLCFLLEGTLRLYPAPPATAVVRSATEDLLGAVARAQALWRAGLQPLAVVVRAETLAGAAELSVVLAGRPEALQSELSTARNGMGSASELQGPEALAERAELRRAGQEATLVLAGRPSLLPRALEALRGASARLGLAARVTVHPLVARAQVEFPGLAAGDARLPELAEELEAPEWQTRWRGLGKHAPRARLAEPAADLMRRLKHSLDPDGLFAGGPT
jgi:FAD/FMN-containing dehydrogenase